MSENNTALCNRRRFIQTLIRAGAAVGLVPGCSQIRRRRQTPPNILFIFSDDLGYHDVGVYGSEIPTPHIDRIARCGIQFSNFYVTAPVCTPSRYSLLTGRYPNRAPSEYQSALGPTKHQEIGLPENEFTLADILKLRDYSTALIGKWHLGHGRPEFGPNAHGFDYFYGFLPGCVDYYLHSYRTEPNWYRNTTLIDEPGYATDLLTEEAVRFIRQNSDHPFFLYLAYNAPHYGKCPQANLLQTPPGYEHLPAAAKADRAVYAAMVQNLDANVGRVLTCLDSLDLMENTIVIFLSDNGGDYDYGGSNQPLSGEKGTLFEGGIKVPCLIQWPRRIEPEQKVEHPFISLDWLPTLVHLAGAKLPSPSLDGMNIAGALLHNEPPPERLLFFTFRNQFAVRGTRWKYLRDNEMRQYLFDLHRDPTESRNLIDAYPGQAHSLQTEYEKFIANLSRPSGMGM